MLTPVTGLVPVAYLHSACAGLGRVHSTSDSGSLYVHRTRGSGGWDGMFRLRHVTVTKCLKLYIFGPLLKNSNSRFLSQKTPYQSYGVIWRLLT